MIIHEIAHALHIKDRNKGINHGEDFQKIAKQLTIQVKAIQDKFPAPYCNFHLSSRQIISGQYDIIEEGNPPQKK